MFPAHGTEFTCTSLNTAPFCPVVKPTLYNGVEYAMPDTSIRAWVPPQLPAFPYS